MPQDLSEALKEATKEVHTQAENAEFMKNFQKGELTREGFKVCGLEVPALAGVHWVGVHPKRRAVILVGMATRDAEGADEHVQGSHFTGHDLEAQRVEMTYPRSHSRFHSLQCSIVEGLGQWYSFKCPPSACLAFYSLNFN